MSLSDYSWLEKDNNKNKMDVKIEQLMDLLSNAPLRERQLLSIQLLSFIFLNYYKLYNTNK